MKIGVLQAGLVPEGLAERYGEYDVVFTTLLRRADPAIEVRGWRVVEGEFPSAPDEADGWVVSGSKHGVYEDHPWIPPLKDFIRAAVKTGAPVIGVCFGHQIMAEALGGRAEKSEKGWGLGPHSYDLLARPAWMSDAPERLTIGALHQDQVTVTPPDATRIAASPFCENAALIYGDVERPYALSIQPHPEFTAEFLIGLLEMRRGAGLPEMEADRALAAMTGDVPPALDADWAAKWFLDFIRMHKK